jgi:monofunctional biosynthetic peptidoglycan transglycosylase
VGLSLLIVVLYRWVNPPITPLMVLRKIENGAPVKQQWKDIEDISPYLTNCAVAAEDNNFLGHHGFDFGAIQKAIDDREHGRLRGASTISQQTAKNIFLWDGRSWVRKGLEVYFTFLIETFWSKERIIEIYLNKIEMGNGIYGAEAAAQCYFHKSAKNLTAYQAALIVAVFPFFAYLDSYLLNLCDKNSDSGKKEAHGEKS